MNKIYGLLTAASLVLSMSLLNGCKESQVVDLYPEFDLDAITNPSSLEQVEEVLSGAYSRFRANDYYGSGSGTGSGWTLMPDVLSDNLFESSTETLANSRVMADWIFNEGTAQVSNFYTAPYAVISAVNIVIRDADKFLEGNELQVNRIKGQAYAIRALAHFDLFRYFATSYGRSSSELALYYSKEFAVSTEVKPARMSNQEYYDNLFADLEAAKAMLSNVDAPINAGGLTRPMIDLTALHALEARVNLYAEQWGAAEAAASAAIQARPLVRLDQEAFSGMYNETSSGEIIWNVQFDAGQGGPTYLVYFATSDRNYFRPSYDIAVLDGESGLIQNGDIRFDAFFKESSGGLAVKKYQGKGVNVDANANAIVFRTGEQYLIRAEARARSGNEAGALADLNELRSARIAGYTNVTLSGQGLLDAIADERRRELFAEGHRFFDLKRTTRVINRGAPCGTSASAAGGCTLSSNAREWTLPYPETVLRANENALPTPGYGG